MQWNTNTGFSQVTGIPTPELRLSESLSNYFGQGRTSQGGSNLFGNQTQTTLVPSSGGNPTWGGGNFVPMGTSGAYGNNTSSTVRPVLGAATSNLGGGAPPGGNPTPAGNGGSPFDAAANAADAQRQAQIAASNAAYDRQAGLLSGQLTDVANQKSSALSDLEAALGLTEKKVGEQKKLSDTMTGEAIGEAGATAQNTQRSNRNVLRALGILNSSYAADKLMAPTTEFDTQRAKLVQTNIDNINKLNDYYDTQVASHQKAVEDLNKQFTSIVDRINNDIRFNGEQKNAGQLAAEAAFRDQMSNIANSFATVQSNVEAAKTNFAKQIAQIHLNANPSANLSGILGTAMNTANQMYAPQQASLTLSEDTRKKLYGG